MSPFVISCIILLLLFFNFMLSLKNNFPVLKNFDYFILKNIFQFNYVACVINGELNCLNNYLAYLYYCTLKKVGFIY